MIGNDIIDIAETKRTSNYKRFRFLEKLFTSQEQQLILNSEDAFVMVWHLWSMKEAAYKLYTQTNPSRFYNPKGFECELKGDSGKVCYKDFECYVSTKMTSQYILSEAQLSQREMFSEAVFLKDNNPKNQSEVMRTIMLNAISKQYRQPKSSIEVNTSEFGIPKVFLDSKQIHVSISHHGNYGAFTIANQ